VRQSVAACFPSWQLPFSHTTVNSLLRISFSPVLQPLNQPIAGSTGAIGGPWDIIMLVSEAPGLILYAVLLALGTSGIALASALFFAKWDKVREAHLPDRGWLEFLLVLGCVTIATLLTGLAYVYITILGLIPVLGAILAVIAAWTTYRTLLYAGLARSTST
jgi:hypothetical protein